MPDRLPYSPENCGARRRGRRVVSCYGWSQAVRAPNPGEAKIAVQVGPTSLTANLFTGMRMRVVGHPEIGLTAIASQELDATFAPSNLPSVHAIDLKSHFHSIISEPYKLLSYKQLVPGSARFTVNLS